MSPRTRIDWALLLWGVLGVVAAVVVACVVVAVVVALTVTIWEAL